MTRPAAIGLDFDGVILQSATIKTDAFRYLFQDHPEHIDAIVSLHERLGGISRLKKFDMIYADILGAPLARERKDALAADFEDYVFDAVLNCPMIAGAQRFLESWYTEVPLFVVSGTPDPELQQIVDARGLRRYFAEVHGSPREKPEILRDILMRYDLSPAQMPFVGDAPSDEDAAQTCGLPFIGVAPQPPGTFRSAQTEIKDLTELDAVLTGVKTS